MIRKKENKVRKLEKVILRYMNVTQTPKTQRIVKGLITKLDNLKKS